MQQTSETSFDYLTPVIVGVGQLLDHPAENEDGLEPLDLIINALKIADEDSCHKFLAKADYIDIQNITSRSYENISGMIIQKLNLSPNYCVYHDVSGELPIKNLCEAANRIASGSSKISVICGGESTWSVKRAKNRGVLLSSWSGTENSSKSWIPNVDDIVRKYGLHLPVRAYALYENACRSRWQQSMAEAQRESGELQKRASEIALTNHFSWTKSRKKVNDIITPSSNNKLIAWPYTKLMIANNNLNSGTAIIITSLGLARAHGINPQKLIYIHAGGYASEPDSILERDNYYHSSAMEAVFDRVFTANKLTMKDIAYTEIYSCFPCVTKLAKRIIHPQLYQDLTVVGGMTFCRAQLSNFMSQAIVEMVRKLRIKGTYGLLYGNGHYLTHAAGVIISTQPPTSKRLPIHLNIQDTANSRMDKIPDLIEQHEGAGTIETYTVVYENNIELFWIVVARTNENKRFIAITKQNARSDRIPLLHNSRDIIGIQGKSTIQNGYNIWSW